jgi:hypothetical protein
MGAIQFSKGEKVRITQDRPYGADLRVGDVVEVFADFDGSEKDTLYVGVAQGRVSWALGDKWSISPKEVERVKTTVFEVGHVYRNKNSLAVYTVLAVHVGSPRTSYWVVPEGGTPRTYFAMNRNEYTEVV